VLRGSATGITTKHAQNWTKATPGVPGKQKSKDVDDQWGSALAFGAFSGGDDADLAVGDPTTQHVTILPGSTKHGLQAKGSEQLSPSTPSVPGKAGSGEDWSSVLAVGDFGHGSAEDLVVADPDAKHHRGSLTVLYGDHHQPAGLTAKHAQHITRSSHGWPGVAETLDYFGSSLAAG
jgi:hypothetical protein